MKWLFIGFLLLFANGSSAQNKHTGYLDSLQRQLKSPKNDYDKLQTLEKISGFYNGVDLNKALTFEQQGFVIAEKLKRDSDKCLLHLYRGETLVFKGEIPAGIKQFNTGFELANEHNFKILKVLVLGDLGLAYEMQGDYTNSLEYFLKCLRVGEQNNDQKMVVYCYVNISVIYVNQNNFDKTIEYAGKVLQSKNIAKNSTFQTKALEMLGTAYMGKNNYTTARKYYNEALQIYSQTKNNIGIATIYTQLVSTYPRDHQMQLELGLKAQAIWEKAGPESLYAISNLGNLGITYGAIARENAISSNNIRDLLAKSENYLSKAIAIAKKTNSKQNIIELTDSLASIYALTGNYRDAYTNLRAHNKLSDSVFSQENKNKIASLEGKHELELKDKQIQINRLELAAQQKQRWFFIAGLVMLVLIALLIYAQSRQRKKANTALTLLNEQLDEANKIKNKFFSILNHDLRSPVSNFLNILHLKQQAPDLLDENASAAYAEQATKSAERLLETMEDLLLWSKGQMENFKPNVKRIAVGDIFDNLKNTIAPPPNIQITFQQPEGITLNTDEHYLKTIMLNLTNNAIKALGETPGGKIDWVGWEEAGVKYLSISDNGPGATAEQLNPLYDESAPVGIKSGLGLHIVRDLAKAIGCKISLDLQRDKGVEIKLVFGQIVK